MADAFDPDKYLAEKSGGAAPTGEFDPDAYLAEKAASDQEPGLIDTAKQGFKDFAEGINAIGAGGAQGLTMGWGDEAAGALHTVADLPKTGMDWDAIKKAYEANRDKIRANNSQIEEAHPVLYTGGMVGGGAAPLVLSGGAAAATKVGPSLARLIGESAALGGVSGAGASEADTLGGVGEDALSGAKMGAMIPGAIGAVGGAARVAGKGVKALGKTQFVQDLSDAMGKTAAGAKLFGKEARQEIIDKARALAGDLGETSRKGADTAGKAIGAAEAAVEKSGAKFDAAQTVAKARAMVDKLSKSKLKSDRDDAAKLAQYLDDLEKGIEIERPVSVTRLNPAKAIPEQRIPGKPAAREELERQAARMRAEAELMGDELSTDIRNITDDQGNALLALMKRGKNAAGEDMASVRTVADMPAVPEQIIPGRIEPATPLGVETKMIKTREGALNPADLGYGDVGQMRDAFNTLSGGSQSEAGKVSNQGLINFLKTEAKGLGELQAPAGSPIRAARDTFGAAQEALGGLGVDASDFRRVAGGGFEINPDAEQKLLVAIKKLATEDQDPFKATGRISSVLDHLEQVDPASAARLRPAIKDIARDIDLASKTGAINITNPSTFTKAGALVGTGIGSGLRNALGTKTASGIAGAANKSAKALGYALDDLPASIMKNRGIMGGSAIAGGQSEPSRHYSMNDGQFERATQALAGTKYEAAMKAALGGDREARNKSLFLIAQDPNAKKALEEAGVYE